MKSNFICIVKNNNIHVTSLGFDELFRYDTLCHQTLESLVQYVDLIRGSCLDRNTEVLKHLVYNIFTKINIHRMESSQVKCHYTTLHSHFEWSIVMIIATSHFFTHVSKLFPPAINPVRSQMLTFQSFRHEPIESSRGLVRSVCTLAMTCITTS